MFTIFLGEENFLGGPGGGQNGNFSTLHSGVKASYRKMNLGYKSFKMLKKYIYMTKIFFINIGGRIKSQISIFYTKVDP